MEKILIEVLRKLADGLVGPVMHELIDELETKFGLTESIPADTPAAGDDPQEGADAPEGERQ